jgi:hypothetical protein
MTLGLTAGAGVRPRASRSRGPSDHADTQLVGHSWHTRSVDLCAASLGNSAAEQPAPRFIGHSVEAWTTPAVARAA